MVLGGVGFVFAAYSAYFHKLGYDWTHLLNGYRPSGIAKLSTGLTENMLNIWYPVANHYARRGFPLYTVDRPAVAYNIATVLVAVAFVGSAFAVAYGARRRALAISSCWWRRCGRSPYRCSGHTPMRTICSTGCF